VWISMPTCVAEEERTMLDPSDLGVFARRAESPRKTIRARRQVKLARLGLACDWPSITMFCATMASLITAPRA